jgi:hypothetical protein
MGMILAESTDHGVWPTVPFGWLRCWKRNKWQVFVQQQ